MPVLKINQGANGELDAGTALNPEQQTLDLDQSRLWIKEQNGWTSFRYNELNSNLKAFRYSKLATTFYTSSLDENNNGMPDGQEEVKRKQKFNTKLKSLESYLDSLSDVKQDFIDEELRLYSLAQISDVQTAPITINKVTHTDARIISFKSVDRNDNEVDRKIGLYKVNGKLKPAVAVDAKLNVINPIMPSKVQFDVIDQGVTRKFAGYYNKTADTTTYFEYLPAPSAANTRWSEVKSNAATKTLPASLSGNTTIKGFLATLASQGETDAITGLFSGPAYMSASNSGNNGFWKWLDGPEAGQSFWEKTVNGSGAKTSRAVAGAFSNWDRGNLEPLALTDGYAAVIGDSGLWRSLNSAHSGAGSLVEYAPVPGLPNLG